MKKLRISKIWIAVVVIVIVAVAAWAMSGGKKEEDINFKEEKVATTCILVKSFAMVKSSGVLKLAATV